MRAACFRSPTAWVTRSRLQDTQEARELASSHRAGARSRSVENLSGREIWVGELDRAIGCRAAGLVPSPRMRGEGGERSEPGEGAARLCVTPLPPHPTSSLRSEVDLSPRAGR